METTQHERNRTSERIMSPSHCFLQLLQGLYTGESNVCVKIKEECLIYYLNIS